MQRPSNAIDNLRNNQQQLDQDGITVGVSRQALEELIEYVEHLEREQPDNKEPVY